MEAYLLRIFQEQVRLQCEFAIRAAHGMDDEIRSDSMDIKVVFYHIQNLLNAVANISKALWGSGGKKADERKELRESINVTDSSPLREVNVRNHFEHFDQRIDQWWEKSSNHIYIDLNTCGVVCADEYCVFRNFDPQTIEVVFWGDKFNIQVIINEIQRILPLLIIETEKPYW